VKPRAAQEVPLTLDDLRTRATITVPQAAAFLGISVDLAYESARRGELDSVSLGRRRLVICSRLLERLGLGERS
jgi:excisionase family DNA binding protein